MAKISPPTITPLRAFTIRQPIPINRSTYCQTNPQFNIPKSFRFQRIHHQSNPARASASTSAVSATCRFSRIPATDIVINFGKYKGKMLGTLPPSYLKWMSNKLRSGYTYTEEWAKLADLVLADPIYKERIEWDMADRILRGDDAGWFRRQDWEVDEFFEIAERFGWNLKDEVGWSKVDLPLLGTSKGGRIPRVTDGANVEVRSLKRTNKKKGKLEEVENGERRKERIERARLRREGGKERDGGYGEGKEEMIDEKVEDGEAPDVGRRRNPVFPGKEALFKKVLNYRRSLATTRLRMYQ